MKEKLKQLSDVTWELPKGSVEGMRVPALVFLSKKMMDALEEGALTQIANVATLPGIYKHSIALPDMHFGYGFPIGGVAALDIKEGGLSPGGIGFDINCGVRLLRSDLTVNDVRPKMRDIVEAMFRNVPAGVGKGGQLKLSKDVLKDAVERGSEWAVENGYGKKEDLEHTESGGRIREADSSKVSDKALSRGAPQLGTLGAGNHFLEAQRVAEIYEPEIARAWGIEKVDQVCFMIHTGSRGFGHQVCSDYIQILNDRFRDMVSKLPDRDLVYAPAGTQECEDYFKAMSCAANFAWANRQMIMHWVRESITQALGKPEADVGLDLVYDVAHNIGKVEKHNIDGTERTVYMHRKGATRCFGPGHPELSHDYQKTGQPVIVPGDMGTASYVLVGTKEAENVTFSSICHGAGRVMSRHEALKRFRGETVRQQLAQKGIYAKGASWKGIAEEAPGVYKDIHEVVDVCQKAGISRKIVRLEPLGVMKG
jgi:tRNA-splicing ligase RtcB